MSEKPNYQKSCVDCGTQNCIHLDKTWNLMYHTSYDSDRP